MLHLCHHVEVDGVVVGCGHHECILDVNEFVMHVRVYMFLCMHCHG